MEGQITLWQWQAMKDDIRKKLNETAENFVYIGCRLKEIEAQESYRQDGAADIYEFAQKEYGLHRSTTQRFMAITSKFSIGGNSTELLPEYKNFGVSKLQEMLTLSDEDCQLLTDKSTVSDIRDFKNFNRQQASEEPAREETERVYTAFQKCIIEFFRQQDKKDVLNMVLKMQLEHTEEMRKQQVELINPSEYGAFNKGIIYMFLYDVDRGVAYKTVTTKETKKLSWDAFLEEVESIYRDSYGPDTWTNFYGPMLEAVEPVKEEPKTPEKPEKTEAEACATSHKNEPPKTEKQEETEDTEPAEVDTEAEQEEEPDTDTESSEGEEETVETAREPEQPDGSIVEDPYYKLQEEAEELALKVAHTMKMYKKLLIDKEEMSKVKTNMEHLAAVVEQLEEMGEERGADEHYRTE